MSMVENMENQIKGQIEQAAQKAKAAGQLDFSALPDFVLEVPREKMHGDFATNIAMLMAKEARLAPRKIAEIMVGHFSTEGTWIDRIEIAGPGFINFYLNHTWVYDVLPVILEQDDAYGKSKVGKGKKVQVEFVSANPTGVLHMGNARGAALGDSLASVLAAAGFDVSREFYINDTGNQIEKFAKSLEARYLQLLGQEVPFPEDGYHGEDLIDTMKNLIQKVGDKYQNMDDALRREFLVRYALDEKISSIRKVLEDFGVHYDVWFSEQTLHDSGEVEKVIAELKKKGHIYENEGAIWFNTTQFGDEKDEVLVRSNGVPTYFAADIAYHKNKFKRGFEQVINIWGADHHGHVARMKGAVKVLGYDPDQLTVILMQLVRLFRDGEIVRMSKRTGTYVTLNELMEDVGRDAARYFFIMRSPDSQMDFDLDLAKSQSADNPVFYVQYAHARICSILRQAEEMGYQWPDLSQVDFKVLSDPSEIALIRKMADLPDEIVSAALNMAPHRMTSFAHDLASLFHGFYTNCRVLTEETEIRNARLLLTKATGICIRNVLRLIGVTAPERM
ncbi:arginine--tRNA ligase [Candidatus Formimonas warabiya]|nr:arginine--tRNA ligase [Candidatus Formimonas warabiya]